MLVSVLTYVAVSAFISCVYCRGCIFNIITHNSDKRHLQAYQSKQSEIIAVNCTFLVITFQQVSFDSYIIGGSLKVNLSYFMHLNTRI